MRRDSTRSIQLNMEYKGKGAGAPDMRFSALMCQKPPSPQVKMSNNTVAEYPAPWELQGRGYILLYKFKKAFIKEQGNVPDFLKGQFAGGFGSVMLVNYEKSNAGPYGEFLFIPGKFHFRKKRLDNISKIYVSSEESVVNGRRNWAIPKEQADFTFERSTAERDEHICIKCGDTEVADFVIRCGCLKFPVSTKLLPFPLVQKQDGKYFFTSFSGHGMGRLARIKRVSVNPAMFPDISTVKPIAVIAVDPFDITFPKARIEAAEEFGNEYCQIRLTKIPN